MAWKLFAHKDKDIFYHIGEKRYVELHYLNLPIVQVNVEEDSNG